jgi:peroxin-3
MIAAITRAFTLIYTLSLLTLLTRIQLNLLGRRSYLSSVVSLAHGTSPSINLENHDDDSPDQAYGNDFETNRQYLTFSWWLLHRGWRDIMLKVETAVKEVFGNVSIRDDVSMERFSELVLDVRRKVEGATEKERQETRWLKFLLPPREEEEFVLRESGMTTPSPGSASPLRRLLDETSDLIDSPPFSRVLTLLLDAGYSTLVDSKIAQQAFKVPIQTPSEDISLSGPRVVEVAEGLKAVKLPVVLAVLTKQAHNIGNGVPNEYLQSMEQVRELEAFAAVVYSCNWEAEVGGAETGEESVVLIDKEEVKEEGKNVEDSVVDVGAASTFESAWGKAVEKST